MHHISCNYMPLIYVVAKDSICSFDTMSMTFAMFSKNLEYLDRVIRDVVL